MSLDASELINQGATRTFFQPGGAGNPVYFYGIDTAYHFVEGMEVPTNGEIAPAYLPDPRNPQRYRLVGQTVGQPDLPTVDLVFMEQWGGIPYALTAPKCKFNLYEVHGKCSDLSDLYRGWDAGYLLVYEGFRFSGPVSGGARTNREGNDFLVDSVSATGEYIYPVGALSFGEEAATSVITEVMDLVFGGNTNCGDCGVADDGSQRLYLLTRTNTGSPSQNSHIVYTLNGGATWLTSAITGISPVVEPRIIDIVGNILLVGTSGSSFYYTVLNSSGAPTTWQTYLQPAVFFRDAWVQSSRSVFFARQGEIYRSTDITTPAALIDAGAGSTILTRITGHDDTVVAVGASGLVYFSRNSGGTWSSTTVGGGSSQLNAVEALTDQVWLVGGANGTFQITRDVGLTWTDISGRLPGITGAAGDNINDIVFVTPTIGYAVGTINNVAAMWATIDGGVTWVSQAGGSPRIANWPLFSRANRVAVPSASDVAVAANTVAVAGLATGGLDGIALLARANVR